MQFDSMPLISALFDRLLTMPIIDYLSAATAAEMLEASLIAGELQGFGNVILCRLWPAVPANPLVAMASPSMRARMCRFTAVLKAPRLAYLWDHAAGGRPLLPAAALLEMAAAAGSCLEGAMLLEKVFLLL